MPDRMFVASVVSSCSTPSWLLKERGLHARLPVMRLLVRTMWRVPDGVRMRPATNQQAVHFKKR